MESPVEVDHRFRLVAYLFQTQVVFLVAAVEVLECLLAHSDRLLDIHQRYQSALATQLRLLLLC